jgi:hypothetical protein
MTRGGPPAWRLCVGPTIPHRKNELVTNNHEEPRTWTDSLDKRNMEMRFGTWNISSLYRAEDGPFRDRIEWCGMDWSGSG